jgi:hypothetical protein
MHKIMFHSGPSVALAVFFKGFAGTVTSSHFDLITTGFSQYAPDISAMIMAPWWGVRMKRFYRFPADADPTIIRWVKILARLLNHWCRLTISAVRHLYEMLARAVSSLLYQDHGPPQPSPRRKIVIMMLGLTGAGKTLMLAALYQYFKLGGGHGITLIPDDASERELSEMARNIQDTRNPYLPEGTAIGKTREWQFDVRIDWENAQDRAFELAYLDYAGQNAQDLAVPLNPEAVPDEQFFQALDGADIVMGILDGSNVLKLMTDGYSAPLVTDIEFILRRLVLAEQKSIHLVISKWDLLVDHRSGHHYTAKQVVGTLESYSPRFRDFLHNPRFKSLRIIPVAALGTGFVHQDPGDPNGKTMIKVHAAQWNPEDVAIPFFCAIPDIIKGDVELLTARADRSRGRKAARSRLSALPSWVTIAAAGLAGINILIAPHVITASVAFYQIVDRIRDTVKERPRDGNSKLHGPVSIHGVP